MQKDFKRQIENVMDHFAYKPTKRSDHEIYNKIITFGEPVIFSKLFRQAYDQTHHVHYTVADHMLDVAIVAIDYYDNGKNVDEKTIVEAALAHDIGILGRYDKWSNEISTCFNHPKDSVKAIANELDIHGKKILSAVKHHMFPLTITPPVNKEGWIIMHTDNVAAISEMLNVPVRPAIHKWVRELVVA